MCSPSFLVAFQARAKCLPRSGRWAWLEKLGLSSVSVVFFVLGGHGHILTSRPLKSLGGTDDDVLFEGPCQKAKSWQLYNNLSQGRATLRSCLTEYHRVENQPSGM